MAVIIGSKYHEVLEDRVAIIKEEKPAAMSFSMPGKSVIMVNGIAVNSRYCFCNRCGHEELMEGDVVHPLNPSERHPVNYIRADCIQKYW